MVSCFISSVALLDYKPYSIWWSGSRSQKKLEGSLDTFPSPSVFCCVTALQSGKMGYFVMAQLGIRDVIWPIWLPSWIFLKLTLFAQFSFLACKIYFNCVGLFKFVSFFFAQRKVALFLPVSQYAMAPYLVTTVNKFCHKSWLRNKTNSSRN